MRFWKLTGGDRDESREYLIEQIVEEKEFVS